MNTPKHHIVIVDDDPDDRECIKDAFLEGKHAHTFEMLHNGQQLLDYLVVQHENRTRVSAILLDLNMPGEEGNVILRQLRENDVMNTIPVIILTTSSSEKDKLTSYAMGANCFVTKPNTFDELVDIADCIARLWLT